MEPSFTTEIVTPLDGYADGGEPYTDEELKDYLGDTGEPTIAQHIRSWRRDLEVMKGCRSEKYRTVLLVYAWNWATCPTRPMTDREHSACRRLARRVDQELQGRTGWHEADSGRRYA